MSQAGCKRWKCWLLKYWIPRVPLKSWCQQRSAFVLMLGCSIHENGGCISKWRRRSYEAGWVHCISCFWFEWLPPWISLFMLQMIQWPWLLFTSTCRANSVPINAKNSQSSYIWRRSHAQSSTQYSKYSDDGGVCLSHLNWEMLKGQKEEVCKQKLIQKF